MLHGILTSCVAMVLSGVHSWSSIMRDCLTCFCSLQPTMWMYFRMRRLWNSTGGIAWDCRMTCKMLSIIYIHNLCVMHLGPGGHFLDVIWRSFSRLRPCLIIWWLGCMVCMSIYTHLAFIPSCQSTTNVRASIRPTHNFIHIVYFCIYTMTLSSAGRYYRYHR